jgi:hypothetical protein
MAIPENTRHDILLIITVALVILFVSGLAAPLATPIEPIIFPPG